MWWVLLPLVSAYIGLVFVILVFGYSKYYDKYIKKDIQLRDLSAGDVFRYKDDDNSYIVRFIDLKESVILVSRLGVHGPWVVSSDLNIDVERA